MNHSNKGKPIKLNLVNSNLNIAGLNWFENKKIKLLAIHGWLDNAASFERLAPLLTNANVVAIDLPGHGYSDHKALGTPLHYIDYLIDIHAIIKALNWDKCILMGHSLGGGLSSIFASAFPEFVHGLICIDALGPYTSSVDTLPSQLARSIERHNKIKTTSIKTYQSVEDVVSARHKAGNLSRRSAKILIERNLKKIENGYQFRTDSRLLRPSMYYLSESQVVGYLSQIKAKTLMIRADQSNVLDTDLLKKRAAVIKNLTWRQVPGHHHAHLDDPSPIATLINPFIESIDG